MLKESATSPTRRLKLLLSKYVDGMEKVRRAARAAPERPSRARARAPGGRGSSPRGNVKSLGTRSRPGQSSRSSSSPRSARVDTRALFEKCAVATRARARAGAPRGARWCRGVWGGRRSRDSTRTLRLTRRRRGIFTRSRAGTTPTDRARLMRASCGRCRGAGRRRANARARASAVRARAHPDSRAHRPHARASRGWAQACGHRPTRAREGLLDEFGGAGDAGAPRFNVSDSASAERPRGILDPPAENGSAGGAGRRG